MLAEVLKEATCNSTHVYHSFSPENKKSASLVLPQKWPSCQARKDVKAALIIQRSIHAPCAWLHRGIEVEKQNKKHVPLPNSLIQNNFMARLEITSKQDQPVTKCIAEKRTFPGYRKQACSGGWKVAEGGVSGVRDARCGKWSRNPEINYASL